jgi:Ser/Thr protein kinase RdoA (MazF antagonist)
MITAHFRFCAQSTSVTRFSEEKFPRKIQTTGASQTAITDKGIETLPQSFPFFRASGYVPVLLFCYCDGMAEQKILNPEELISVVSAFLGQNIEIDAICPCTEGLVNQTYTVETPHQRYILQSLNAVFTAETVQDSALITDYLHQYQFPVPRFLKTLEGAWVSPRKGHLWRMMTALEGKSWAKFPSADYAFQAGQLIGKFHHLLQGSKHEFAYHYEGFHDTPRIVQNLRALPKRFQVSAAHQNQIEQISEAIQPLFLPEDLPTWLIHGDLKSSNLLFDDHGKPTGLIDLDTLMYAPLAIEWGDALRSWGMSSQAPSQFRVDVLEQALRGYFSSGIVLDFAEVAYIPQGIQLITLELASRYLIDYYEDAYFGWNADLFASRQENHQQRIQNLLGLYKDVHQKQALLHEILQDLYSAKSAQLETN